MICGNWALKLEKDFNLPCVALDHFIVGRIYDELLIVQ